LACGIGFGSTDPAVAYFNGTDSWNFISKYYLGTAAIDTCSCFYYLRLAIMVHGRLLILKIAAEYGVLSQVSPFWYLTMQM